MFPIQDVNRGLQNIYQYTADILDSHFSLVFTREVGIRSLNNTLLKKGELIETVHFSESALSDRLGKVITNNSPTPLVLTGFIKKSGKKNSPRQSRLIQVYEGLHR